MAPGYNDDELGDGPSGPPPLRFSIASDGAATAIPGIPTRHDFVVADEEGRRAHLETLAAVRQGQTVRFRPNDIHEGVEYHRPEGQRGGESVQRYVLTFYGILEDGSKAQVVMRDVPVYFDIWFPEEGGEHVFVHQMSEALQEFGVVRTETGRAFPLRGYRVEPRQYLRVFFSNTASRKKAIQAVRKMSAGGSTGGYETASDDLTNYFRMVARTHTIPLCDWLTVSRYAYLRGGAACGCELQDVQERFRTPHMLPSADGAPLTAHVLNASVLDVRALINPMKPDPEVEKMVSGVDLLVRDRTLITTFDIETHSPDKGTGKPPHQDKPRDAVFMLCATAHWLGDKRALARVCLTTQEAAPDSRWTTVVCGPGGLPGDRPRADDPHGPAPNVHYGQDSLLLAFALVWRAWAPDLHAGFNDGQYDWPFVVGKAYKLGLLGTMVERMSAAPRKGGEDPDQVLKWQWREDARVKVSAEKTHYVSYLKLPGCVPLDVRLIYMRLYPKGEKTSLKACLALAKLGGKADMPYTEMWHIYEDAAELATRRREHAPGSVGAPGADEEALSAERMRRVSHYCIIDAARCQELLVQRSVIVDAREIGNYSCTSINDCIYYANGHKVSNMLYTYAHNTARPCPSGGTFPILGSMISEDVTMEGKYPGAYVVPPEKGLEEDLPITGLDFASLYPSLIRTYNLSLDMAVYSEAEALRLEAAGEEIYRVAFEFGGETVRGWFVRHRWIDEKHGLFSLVLADLFYKRATMKVGLKALEAQIEFAEQVLGRFRGSGDGPEAFAAFLARDAEAARARAARAAGDNKKAAKLEAQADSLARFADVPDAHAAYVSWLDDVEFRFKGIDAKQKAVKVFMNTFYGAAGLPSSPLFMLALAGGVTSAGRYNLKMVADFVCTRRFAIKYGDTDSLYTSCPPECYRDGELAYWRAVRDAFANAGLEVPDVVRVCAADGDAQSAYDAKRAELEAKRAKIDRYLDAELEKCRARSAERLSRLADSPPKDALEAFFGSPAQVAALLESEFDNGEAQARGLHVAMMEKGYAEPLAELGERPPAGAAELVRRAASPLWLQRVFDAQRALSGGETSQLEAAVRAAYKMLAVRKVEITMEQMGTLRDEVNAHLHADNGGHILKMAYEEVLYPVLFTGKKKYAGVAHVYGPNFDIPGPEKMFVRGVDIVKQGQTKLARTLGLECLWRAAQLNPPGTRVPYIDRVEAVIRECCAGMSSFSAADEAGTGLGTVHWDVTDFVQTDAWKPDKQNLSVQKFMRRMRARHKMQLAENEVRAERGEPLAELDYVEPEPGSRFAYLITDAGPSFTLAGYSRGAPSKGDLMEYVPVAKKRGLRINVAYYLEHYVVGLCARFINYDSRFDLPPQYSGEVVDPKKADEYSQRQAKKHLCGVIRGLSRDTRGASAKLGREYRKAYQAAATKVDGALQSALAGDAAAAAGARLLTGGDDAAMHSYARAVCDLDPHARAAQGAVDYELFLRASEGQRAPPVAESLRLAAAVAAQHTLDALQEPAPAWDPRTASLVRPGAASAWKPLTGHVADALGVAGRAPAARKRLYAALGALRPPRRARSGVKHAALIMQDTWTEVENDAYMAIEDRAPMMAALSDRVQASLEELVAIGRDACGGAADAAPRAEARVVGALRCAPEDAAVLREVRSAWLSLVGVAMQRALHSRLVDELERLRDAGL